MKFASSSKIIQNVNVSQAPASKRSNGPKGYQVLIAILILGIATLGFLVLQYANTVQLQRTELSSNNNANQLAEVNKILMLEKTTTLANHTSVSWPGANASMPLTREASCVCFVYSGYLNVIWNSTAKVKFDLVQFQLVHDTGDPNTTGDYKLAVSSADNLQMMFVSEYCPSNGCGPITYTIIYHY